MANWSARGEIDFPMVQVAASRPPLSARAIRPTRAFGLLRISQVFSSPRIFATHSGGKSPGTSDPREGLGRAAGAAYSQRQSLPHSGRALFAAGEPYSQRESLIRSGRALFTAGGPYSQREVLIRSGRASFAAGEAPAQGETALRPGKRPVRGENAPFRGRLTIRGAGRALPRDRAPRRSPSARRSPAVCRRQRRRNVKASERRNLAPDLLNTERGPLIPDPSPGPPERGEGR